MKLAISNIAWDESMDNEVYALMRGYGFSGLEIAPTRIFTETPYDRLDEANQWKERLTETYQLSVPSMQSIWYGKTEKLFGTTEEREILIAYTKKAIDFASAIGCKNLVFGCPRNRVMPEGTDLETALSFFKELGDYADSKGTVIGMEANPPIYNTNFINGTKSAIELVKAVDSKGFLLNLDVGTMIENQEPIDELCGLVKYINHVHISEPGLKVIEMRTMHKELKLLLNKEKYAGFVSIEMGKQQELAQIERVMAYVKEVYGGES